MIYLGCIPLAQARELHANKLRRKEESIMATPARERVRERERMTTKTANKVCAE
jgi:hypothetical protein